MTQDISPETTAALALPLSPGVWALDPLCSSVGFTVRHLGIAKVRGRFTSATADLYVGGTAADVVVSAEIALASLDTGNPERDAHLRGTGLLDVERRPTMTFRSTGIRGEGADWSMEGDMTLGGVTRPVTFAVEFGGLVDSPVDGRKRAGFEATGEIRRSDFGLDFGAGLLGDVVKVQLDLQFTDAQGQGG
ncbi:YceI family protein [Streptomyces sp. NPDC052051]|uniref:YceI family protein n=1 Tax=Streptomyces sp. NPDC052051 TaxID=3154649 RepID=UPI00341FC805